ncbi:peptidoglycan-binding domain-containing protein [Roseibium sp.]|uniref:peptidoglycan-binding domain-containing protein n=1 Tax=Roseibium sp. TaxID=1936156 RepID=UPI003A97168B
MKISLAAVFVISILSQFLPEIATAQDALVSVKTLQSDMNRIEDEIERAEAESGKYKGGALAVLSALNLETLRLTRSILEARIAAEQSGAPIEITVPAVKPDPEMAASILADIQRQTEIVDQAKSEAGNSAGLMQALALTRYETERLTLAQLQQAWFRAQYGIAFPMTGAPQASQAATASPEADQAAENSANSKPEWADADFQNIDYGQEIFRQLAAQSFDIKGWWGIERSRASIDDSPQIYAINVSAYGTGYSDHPTLKAMCIEHEARVIFDADSFIMGDYNSDTLPVTVRIDKEQAHGMQWSKVTSNKGAGLFGASAEEFMRDLKGKEKIFLRLQGDRGKQVDMNIKLAGVDTVLAEIANACQFSLLDLRKEDYVAIQTLLNAAGFDLGTPDGQWGPASRKAISDYQTSVDLPVTGVPDEATLAKMGVVPN